jgi:RNA polymerase sigma factor (sigma-70 family)
VNESVNKDTSLHLTEHAGLLYNIAKSFYPRDQDQFEEYLQICRIALWEAVKKYDDSKNCKLTTYITHRSRWALIRHIKKDSKISYSQDMPEMDDGYIPNESVTDYMPENDLNENELNILALKYKGYSFKEMGEILDEKKSTVHRRYQKLASKLRELNK